MTKRAQISMKQLIIALSGHILCIAREGLEYIKSDGGSKPDAATEVPTGTRLNDAEPRV